MVSKLVFSYNFLSRITVLQVLEVWKNLCSNVKWEKKSGFLHRFEIIYVGEWACEILYLTYRTNRIF